MYGGARGGGKTDGVLGKYGLKGERYGKGFNALFLRKEMPAQDDLIERAKEIYLPLGSVWYEQKKMFVLPRGGRIRFRPLENVADAEKYQGQNITDAAIEEAGQYADSAPIDRLFGCLRSVGGIPVQLILTANPGGPGHGWIKERFVTPAPLGMRLLVRNLPNGKEHHSIYIPSRVQNNKILLQNDPEYINRLYLTGSPELVRAWLEGDWNVVLGAYFSDFRIDPHVIRPFPIPKHWATYFGFDWGYASPFAGVWIAISSGKNDEGQELPYPQGSIVVFRERWGTRLTNPQIAAAILAANAETWEGTAADPSIFKTDGGPSIAEQIANAGLDLAPADNSRLAGWSQLRLRLISKPSPLIYFFETCPYLIECMQAAQHDIKHPEDLDTTGADHVLDALRYAAMRRPVENLYTTPAKPDRLGKVTVGRYIKEVRDARASPRV